MKNHAARIHPLARGGATERAVALSADVFSRSVDLLPSGYRPFLEGLKTRIRAARVKAALASNRELVLLYWELGRRILERQKIQGWGAKVIDRLGCDLRKAFPGMKGLSRANLLYMRAFAEAYANLSIVQQAAGQIPWFHNVVLITKIKDPAIRLWYAQKTVEHGWSRAVLVHQIETGLHVRQGRAVTNFRRTLPPTQSDLAEQALKDPYVFDFLGFSGAAAERTLERGFVEHIRKFLLELGVGFAFVGSQVRFEVEGEDFYVDLLFYHLRLRCFVVIEIKNTKFKPEYAGQLNFYLSAVDAQMKHPADHPTIGIILCREKKRLVAEYALRNIHSPIGVARFDLVKDVPAEWKASLPSIRELEARLVRGGG